MTNNRIPRIPKGTPITILDPGPTMGDIAAEITAQRKSIGLSQVAVASMFGVNVDTIVVYENARRPIPRIYRMAIRAIADGVLDPVLFDVDPEIAARVAKAIADREDQSDA